MATPRPSSLPRTQPTRAFDSVVRTALQIISVRSLIFLNTVSGALCTSSGVNQFYFLPKAVNTSGIMGPLEMSGTSSAAAQKETLSCVAGRSSKGERTGPVGEAQPLPKQPGCPQEGGFRTQEKTCHRENPHHRAVLTCLCDRSLVTLPNAMLFAGSDILRSLRTTFSLAQHFFWLTSHPWPVWLQHSPWGSATNPAQYGLTISTPSLGTSWG